MLNFVLCDDNYIILDRLGKMLDSLFIKYNVEACILYKTTTPEDLLDYVNSNDVNVLILDIDLKSSMSGLDIAEKVRKKDKNIYIIFSTAHLEYGLVAYRYKTFDYIPKPITTQRLEDTFLRLLDDMNGNVNEYIQLDNSKILIKKDSIQYIKKEGMKVIFHTDEKKYEVYSSFIKILKNLPKDFIRCHKSYIVNIQRVSEIDLKANIIYLNNTQNKCYIGAKYKNDLMEVLKNEHFTNNLECG